MSKPKYWAQEGVSILAPVRESTVYPPESAELFGLSGLRARATFWPG
jgi:hypothetical protein